MPSECHIVLDLIYAPGVYSMVLHALHHLLIPGKPFLIFHLPSNHFRGHILAKARPNNPLLPYLNHSFAIIQLP